LLAVPSALLPLCAVLDIDATLAGSPSPSEALICGVLTQADNGNVEHASATARSTPEKFKLNIDQRFCRVIKKQPSRNLKPTQKQQNELTSFSI
jgi:hypothetical protein